MKSSNEWPHRAIEYAKLRILKFAESPLEDANFFNGYMELVSSDSGHSDLDDALHTLLAKAKKDKFVETIMGRRLYLNEINAANG